MWRMHQPIPNFFTFPTAMTFLSLPNLDAEEDMQLRRLIKSSNERLGPYLFEKIEFYNFLAPTAEIPRRGPPPPHGTVSQKAHI